MLSILAGKKRNGLRGHGDPNAPETRGDGEGGEDYQREGQGEGTTGGCARALPDTGPFPPQVG